MNIGDSSEFQSQASELSRPSDDGEPRALTVSTINGSRESYVAKTTKTPETIGSGSFGGSDGDAADDVPPFPIETFPSTLRDLVLETSRVTQTPVALAAVVALGVISGSSGGGLLVKGSSGLITPANLFLLAIARSGTGKGRVFSIIAKPLHHAASAALEHWTTTDLPRIEANLNIAKKRLEKLVKEAANESDSHARFLLSDQVREAEEERHRFEREKEREPCYYVGDVTREKLAVALSAQPREALASLSPEARGILSVITGRYSKGKASDEDIYLSAYSGESYRVDRLNRPPVSLTAPRLSVCWLIQPDAARGLVEDDRMTESGLLPRFLVCDVKAEPEDEPENIKEMDRDVIERWADLVDLLIRQYRNSENPPFEIDMSREAGDLFREFNNENKRTIREGGDLRDVDSYVSRWAENAIRLSLCLHAATHPRNAHSLPLDANTAKSAILIVRWFARHQLTFLSVSRTTKGERRLSRLIEILVSKGGIETRRNLTKSHGFDEDEIARLVKSYPDRIQTGAPQATTAKGGRPSHCVWLNGHVDSKSSTGKEGA
jgi:hypothetical protein